MRHYVLFVLFLLSVPSFAQLDTNNIGCCQHFAKNQLAIQINTWQSSDGPWLGLEYRRSIKANLRDSVQLTQLRYDPKFLYFGLYFTDFNESKIPFKNHTVLDVSDSIVTQRSNGSSAADYNLQFGIEKQFRNLFSVNNTSGLQLFLSYYGILGYTRKVEQYIHNQFQIDTIQSGTIYNSDLLNKYEVLGQRNTDFLRIGLGLSVGFDIAVSMSRNRNILFGLNLNLLNGSGDFLVNNKTVVDQDDFYSEEPKKILFHTDPGFNIRVGFEF